MNRHLIGVCGPTASGKTAVAVELCKRINGEVVSADSMQVYRGMDILSAKPTKEEMGGVTHHLIDCVEPTRKYNASSYREEANAVISEIRARGKVPVLCGGTGLYIDALIRGMRLSEKADEALRDELKTIAARENGPEILHEMLKNVDPESAEKYPAGDVRRVIRSIEIYRLTGMTRARQEEIDARAPNAYDARLFALRWPRETLYRRIDARVDEMISRGLINEVSALIQAGENAHPTAVQAIGYKEIAAALRGECAMSDAIVRMKTATRNYAKRQMTWFQRDSSLRWIDAEGKCSAEIADEIQNQLPEEI